MTQPTRRIEWSAADHDYAMFIGDEFVGFARNHFDAEIALDKLVYDRLVAQLAADIAAKEALIDQLSNAYKSAKADGRELDAALYKREGTAAIAELKVLQSVTVEQAA